MPIRFLRFRQRVRDPKHANRHGSRPSGTRIAPCGAKTRTFRTLFTRHHLLSSGCHRAGTAASPTHAPPRDPHRRFHVGLVRMRPGRTWPSTRRLSRRHGGADLRAFAAELRGGVPKAARARLPGDEHPRRRLRKGLQGSKRSTQARRRPRVHPERARLRADRAMPSGSHSWLLSVRSAVEEGRAGDASGKAPRRCMPVHERSENPRGRSSESHSRGEMSHRRLFELDW